MVHYNVNSTIYRLLQQKWIVLKNIILRYIIKLSFFLHNLSHLKDAFKARLGEKKDGKYLFKKLFLLLFAANVCSHCWGHNVRQTYTSLVPVFDNSTYPTGKYLYLNGLETCLQPKGEAGKQCTTEARQKKLLCFRSSGRVS